MYIRKVTILSVALLLVGTMVLAGIATDNKPTTTKPPRQQNTLGKIDSEAAKSSAQPVPASRAGEQIKWQVISSGGTNGASSSYQLSGTTGQLAVGKGSSAGYQLGHGFWEQFFSGGTSCCVIRADVDHNGTGPDIGDLVYMVNFMFNGGPLPPCEDPPGSGYFPETDVDGSGTGPDIADLVYLVNYMFNGGPVPVPCP